MRPAMIKPTISIKRRTLAALLCATALLIAHNVNAQTERLGFSGGPDGSTFQLAANGIAMLVSRGILGIEVHDSASAGSVENLQRIESGTADFGIAHASDVFLARHGRLTRDAHHYRKIMTVSRLYGIPAHLVVRADSAISDVTRLAGKRIAVGPPGSGAAVAAQRYFESLGLWHRIRPQFINETRAMAALTGGRVDAAWIMTPAPNAAIVSAASTTRLRLLPLQRAARQGTLAATHPYYAAATIPAGTYPGVEQAVQTIEDAALWVAGSRVDDGNVRAALERVYSSEGLEYVRTLAYPTANMSADSALRGVVTPLHGGARGYWQAMGQSVPEPHPE